MEQRVQTPPSLIRVEEAAQALGISRSRAYELVQRGELVSVLIGRSRRIPVAELHAYIERLVEEQIEPRRHGFKRGGR